MLNKVTVKSHTHIIGEDGACTECGKSCGHISGNINYDSGICETCGKQLEAAVQYKDGAVVGFESFLSALDSVPHNMTEEVTVVLLQNYELNSEYNLNVSNNIRLDLNTHTISGTGSFIVKGASEFTLAHGDLGENITVEAAGGDLTVAEDFGNAGTIRVTDEESKVSIQGGSIQYLRLSFIDTETLKNIKLTGGKFGTINFNADGADQ